MKTNVKKNYKFPFLLLQYKVTNCKPYQSLYQKK